MASASLTSWATSPSSTMGTCAVARPAADEEVEAEGEEVSVLRGRPAR
jgi:hypothetical protein